MSAAVLAGGCEASEGEGRTPLRARGGIDGRARQHLVIADLGFRARDVRAGVLVARVDKNRPASRAGLKPGDVIVSVKRQRVSFGVASVADLASVLRRFSPGDSVRLEVEARRTRRPIVVTIQSSPR